MAVRLLDYVKAGILGSNEFFQDVGSNNYNFLQGLYQEELGRTADAAGLAAAQTYSGFAGQDGITGTPEASVQAFTLMKVIGRDVWIGVWALVLSIIATTRWETNGVTRRADPGEIWRRFPKFVIGFLIASVLNPSVGARVEGINYFADTMLFAGAILALAGATTKSE